MTTTSLQILESQGWTRRRKVNMSAAPLTDAIVALSRFLVAEASLGDTLHRVSELAIEAIPSANYLGISLLDGRGRANTAVFTDPRSPEIDVAQYAEGIGPCLDAWREKRVVRIEDMRLAGDTYPRFAAAALDHGILSTMSMPIVVGEDGIGAVNMYADRTGGFSAEDEATAWHFVTAAAVVMANSQAYWQAVELADGLGEAMKSRAMIEQAKGMLMAHERRLSADEAFEVLKKASQRENVRLRDIAYRMVDRRPITSVESK